MQFSYEQALLLNFYGQPISMDDGCAMRKCGSWDVQWLLNDARIVYCIHLHMGMCYDFSDACFTFHSIEPGKFHNE